MTPIREAVRLNGQWMEAGGVRPELSAPPPPIEPEANFTLGLTRPNVATRSNGTIVGPRKGVASLSNYAGDLTNLAPGEVVSDLIITGRFDPNAEGAVLRDSIIKVGDPGSIIDASPKTPSQVRTRQAALLTRGKTTTIEFCEVDPSHFTHDVYGPQGGNFLIRRSNIHGVVDGVVAHGSSTMHKAWRIESSWIHDLRFYQQDPRQGPEGTHNDGVQSEGNADGAIVGCDIEGGVTSCVLVTNNVPGGYGYMRITDNWFTGHPTSGSTINIAGADIGGLEVKRNRISRTALRYILVSSTNRQAVKFGCVGPDGDANQWTYTPDANVFLEDGLFCRPNNG